MAGMTGAYSPSYYSPVENVGLYWHFVDLVWIYLIPAALPDQQETWLTRITMAQSNRTHEHLTTHRMSCRHQHVRGHLGRADGRYGLTVFAASVVELGIFNIVVALLIATIKGTLVVLFFMHLRYSTKLTMVDRGRAVFFLFIMFSLSMTDYLTRGWATYAESLRKHLSVASD